MSATSMTISEVMFSSVGDYTELNTFTSEAHLTAGQARPIIPSNFFSRKSDIGKLLKVHASGLVSSTGTPTFQVHLSIGTSTTWSSSDTCLAQSTTITTQSGISNAHWWMDAYVSCTEVGFGAVALSCNGIIHSPSGWASPFAYHMAPTIGSPQTWSVSSLDSATPYYLGLSATCGTSNASNKIQCKRLVLFGLN